MSDNQKQKTDNNKNDLFNKMVDSNPFLKNVFASSRPIVEAMTDEERERFVNKIMEIGKGK